MQCILESRTVNLYKCSDKAQSLSSKGKPIKPSSQYTTFIRFFKMSKIGQFIWSIQNLIVTISPPELVYLIVDRTNWQFGKKNINLLTIGALCQDIFMPLMWTQLDKQGNSNFKEREKLIARLLKLLQRNNRNSNFGAIDFGCEL